MKTLFYNSIELPAEVHIVSDHRNKDLSLYDKQYNINEKMCLFGKRKIAYIIHRYTYRTQVPAKLGFGIAEWESAGCNHV